MDAQRNHTQGIHCMEKNKNKIKGSEKGNNLNTKSCVWTLLDVIKVWEALDLS